MRRLLESQISRQDISRDSYAETARFRLPMNFGGKEATEMVKDLLDRLREELNSQQNDRSALLAEVESEELIEKEETIEKLKQSVEDLLDTIDQLNQEHERNMKMYKKFEDGGFFDTLYPTAKDAYVSDSDDSVVDMENEDTVKYQTLRKRAMRDQKRITESAIELGKQRAALQVNHEIISNHFMQKITITH